MATNTNEEEHNRIWVMYSDILCHLQEMEPSADWEIEAEIEDRRMSDYRVTFHAVDGRQVCACAAWPERDSHGALRLKWTGLLPPGAFNVLQHGDRVSPIIISTHRTPKAIALDLSRRLLPGYTALYGRAVAAIAKHEEYVTGRRMMIQQVCDATGAELRESDYGNTKDAWAHIEHQMESGRWIRAHVELYGEDSLTVTINAVSVDVVIDLLKVAGLTK